MTKVFFDSDVLLDVILARKPYVEHSLPALNLAARNVCRGYTSPVVLTNINNIVRKLKDLTVAYRSLRNITGILRIAPLTEKNMLLALDASFQNDYEDYVQYACAEKIGCDFLVSRNVDDYPEHGGSHNKPRVLTPADYVRVLRGS